MGKETAECISWFLVYSFPNSKDNIIFTQSFFDLLDKNPSNVFSFRHLLSAMFPMATKQEKKMMMELVKSIFLLFLTFTGISF